MLVRTPENGGAAGSVGDDHAFAEKLRQQFDVGGLPAPRARPRKLE